jgi:putative two-component system response regulator
MIRPENTSPSVLFLDERAQAHEPLLQLMRSDRFCVSLAGSCEEAAKMARYAPFDMLIIHGPLQGPFTRELLMEEFPTGTLPVLLLAEEHSSFDRLEGMTVIDPRRPLSELYEAICTMAGFPNRACKGRVLIVDDSDSLRLYLEEGLAEAGFAPTAAGNGRDALDSLHSTPAGALPQVIVTDLNMPEMDGIDFADALRKDPLLQSIPLLVMSERKDRELMRRMLQMGAAQYLCKPINLDHFIVTIEKLVNDLDMAHDRQRSRIDHERSLLLGSIMSLTQALEARDGYTRTHSDEVARISGAVARALGLEPREIERIELAGKLHDIGKIGVPDQILLKPGRLSTEEFQIVQKHPVIAKTILEPLDDLADIIPAIAEHHERFDGRGYPCGLKGKDIHLWARILSVADIFNALTSHRPYRRGMGFARALEIIREIRGTRLCPECVDVFLKGIGSEFKAVNPAKGVENNASPHR